MYGNFLSLAPDNDLPPHYRLGRGVLDGESPPSTWLGSQNQGSQMSIEYPIFLLLFSNAFNCQMFMVNQIYNSSLIFQLKFRPNPWFSMIFHDFPWFSMVFHGSFPPPSTSFPQFHRQDSVVAEVTGSLSLSVAATETQVLVVPWRNMDMDLEHHRTI